jgi:hypothetical protein
MIQVEDNSMARGSVKATTERTISTGFTRDELDLRFGVMFLGYGAKVVAIEGETEIDYAQLDFVSGCVILMADNARIHVPSLSDLAPFVASLPTHASYLREAHHGGSATTIDVEENSISFNGTADLDQVLLQLSRRCWEVLPVLSEAEEFGKKITRRPYGEHIDEIAATGIGRVVLYGFGLFKSGRLCFRRERAELLVDMNTKAATDDGGLKVNVAYRAS